MQDASSLHVLRGSALTLSELVLDTLPVAVYVCDADGFITRHNRRARELWGRSPALEKSELFGGAPLYSGEGVLISNDQSPMATVLRTGVPARQIELMLERASGERVWVEADAEPLTDAVGNLLGAICCLRDISAHKRTEQSLRNREEFLWALVDTTPECVKLVGEDGALLHMNQAGLRMIEADALEGVIGSSTFDLIHASYRDSWRDHHRRVCAGESLAWEFEIVGLHGTRRCMETHAVPLKLPDGAMAQLAVTRDISERKRSELQQRLLINELNHRVKNTLSTVQSIVMQSLRNAHTLEQARPAIEHRLLALARTHDVLTAEQWQGAELEDLVEGSLSVHCSDRSRLRIEGPVVRLLPQPSLTFALALHELCTNAVKYGALSNDTGRVEVTWNVTEDGGQRQLHLSWRESGGPEVHSPNSHGFGSRLIERYLGAQLQGTVQWNFERTGVVCEVAAPISE
jgi:two-component system, chemotaxis family, CheB/CheR fusion protein